MDRVEDQRACFEIRLGKQLVVGHARFPHDLFFPNDGRFVVVRDHQVVDCLSCGAMESQVSFVSSLVFSCQPNESDGIVVPHRTEREEGWR